MRLTIERAELAATVGWAARALPPKPATAILAGILLQAGGTTLTASATDYDNWASAAAGASADEPGEVLVPGRLLEQFVSSLAGQAVELETGEAGLILRCGTAIFTLAVLPLEEYPEPPPMPEATGACDSGELAASLGRVAIAASADRTLPILTAVSVEAGPDSITLTALDRYQIATAQLPWIPASADAAGSSALVPARMLAGFAKGLSDGKVTIGLSAGGELAGLSDGTRQLVTRCIAGEYPKWRRFFPEHRATTVTVSSADLAAAVRRVALAADHHAPVQLSVASDAVLLETAGDGKTGSETLAAAVEGEPARTRLNPQYLADGLAAAGGTVRIGLTDGDRFVAITPELEDDSFRYLVVHVR
jgi:DNA polymerase III subunit beta